MKIINKTADIESFLSLLKRRGRGENPEIEAGVRRILNAVKKQGNSAVRRYTKKFDGHERLKIPAGMIKKYTGKADNKKVYDPVVAALKLSAARIRRFHEQQKEASWSISEDGIKLGQVIRPIERVGVYVPGGKASYPSTVLMNVIPAQVAGVKEIALAVPARGAGINPYVMVAIKLLGLKEVYSIGGAQAIAALAYGTETIRKVDKIVGPGNIYVTTAKKLVFGEVDIDMTAGPSEILIIADSSANPAFVASDLLSQAEHDELASPVLITDSKTLARAVGEELKTRLSRLKRKEIAGKSLKKYGAIIIVKNMERAVELSNKIAPEHLEIMTKTPQVLLKKIKNAGAVFLGQWSPEPLGDYSAGPNHTLPTGGTARFSSPLGVYDFIKRTSLLQFTRKGFSRLAGTVETIAEAEGFEAHAGAIRVRVS